MAGKMIVDNFFRNNMDKFEVFLKIIFNMAFFEKLEIIFENLFYFYVITTKLTYNKKLSIVMIIGIF